jgi:methionyl-tRNA formyltransferase
LKIIIFGDDEGVAQLLNHVPKKNIVAIVGAQNRPQFHIKLQSIANKFQIPLLIQPPLGIKAHTEFRTTILNLCPDLYFINSYSMHLDQELLDIPTMGGINLHSALLPKNRGANPIQWGIIKGENETGVTLHELVDELDAGPIITQDSTPILFEDTWLTVRERVFYMSEKLLSANVPKIIEGTWQSYAQNDYLSSTNYRRKAADSEFTWNDSIFNIYNKIRALIPPMPAAFAIDADGTKEIFSEVLSPMHLTVLKFLRSKVVGGYLKGKDVQIRPLAKEDSSILFEWINCWDTFVFNSPFRPPSNKQEGDQWIKTALFKRKDLVIFAIEEIKTGETIGTCKFIEINWQNRSAQLQIHVVDEKYLETSYTSDSIELLCNFGYSDLNLNKIYSHIRESNQNMVESFKKVGFEVEGFMSDASHIEDKFENGVLMSIFRGR